MIARLVEAEQPDSGRVSQDEAARRLVAWKAFVATLPPVTEDERRAVCEAQAEMYDEDGLPR